MLTIGTLVQWKKSWTERIPTVLTIGTSVNNWYSSTVDEKLDGAYTESVNNWYLVQWTKSWTGRRQKVLTIGT